MNSSIIITIEDVTDDLENNLSASLNFLCRLSCFEFKSLTLYKIVKYKVINIPTKKVWINLLSVCQISIPSFYDVTIQVGIC